MQPEVAAAARQLGFQRTSCLSEEQHLCLLQYLCDEMLETHALRDTLQSAPEFLPVHPYCCASNPR